MSSGRTKDMCREHLAMTTHISCSSADKGNCAEILPSTLVVYTKEISLEVGFYLYCQDCNGKGRILPLVWFDPC